MSTIESLHVPERAAVTVSRFITRVWEHPLLTDRTREFRKKSLSAIALNMETHGFESDEYIALPVGSFLWGVDDASDIDYMVLHTDPRGDKRDRRHFYEKLKSAEEQPIGELHLVRALPRGALISDRNLQMAAALLLTPDEYLLDHAQGAGVLRLQIMDVFSQDPEVLWTNVREHFDYRFRNWALTDVLVNHERVDWKRGSRYFELLGMRGSQTKTCAVRGEDVWGDAFQRAKRKFTVPSFYTYQHALIQTEGSLNIDPRFASVGISSLEAA